MKAAKKDSENPFFKSKYADLGSVWKACHEALSDNGFSVVQGGTFKDGHFFMVTTLIHSSGQSISGDYIILPVKGDPQAYGSAWTYARRYSLAAMVGVISEDDDAEGATDHRVESQLARNAENPSRTYVPSDAPKTLPVSSNGPADLARFIPSKVAFAPGKGKGANKTFSKITSPDGNVYDGTEIQGQLAESARTSGKEIVVAFSSSQYGLKANQVKLNENSTELHELDPEEVPF